MQLSYKSTQWNVLDLISDLSSPKLSDIAWSHFDYNKKTS